MAKYYPPSKSVLPPAELRDDLFAIVDWAAFTKYSAHELAENPALFPVHPNIITPMEFSAISRREIKSIYHDILTAKEYDKAVKQNGDSCGILPERRRKASFYHRWVDIEEYFNDAQKPGFGAKVVLEYWHDYCQMRIARERAKRPIDSPVSFAAHRGESSPS
jgi:hypothetical protein